MNHIGMMALLQQRCLEHYMESMIIVFLVSAVYSCEKGHKILACDEMILKKIPKSLVPFSLLHKTGFTKNLIDIYTGFCRQGINFYSMETLILLGIIF